MTTRNYGVPAVIGSSMAVFWSGAFIFGFPGVMGPFWRTMFDVGRGTVGNTLFFVLAGVGTFMFLVGRWQEQWGTQTMIRIGAFICGLSVLIVAFAKSIAMVYLWALLTGIASCFVYIPALTTVQRWYPTRRGLVSGIVNLVFGLSAAIMSPIFRMMLDSLGYVTMGLVVAGLALLIGLTAAYFARVPDRAAISPAPQRSLSANPPQRVEHSLTVADSVRTRSFWFLWLTWALQGAAGIAMVMLSTAYGLARGFNLESAVIILTAFNITNGASRLVTGYLSDIIGRNVTMSITFFAAGCAYFLLPLTTSLPAAALLAAVVGFAFGSLFAVSAPLASDCFGLAHFGAVFGLVFTAYGFIAGPLGPSLSGYLLDLTGGNFTVVFVYLGFCCILSGFFIRLVVPEPRS